MIQQFSVRIAMPIFTVVLIGLHLSLATTAAEPPSPGLELQEIEQLRLRLDALDKDLWQNIPRWTGSDDLAVQRELFRTLGRLKRTIQTPPHAGLELLKTTLDSLETAEPAQTIQAIATAKMLIEGSEIEQALKHFLDVQKQHRAKWRAEMNRTENDYPSSKKECTASISASATSPR